MQLTVVLTFENITISSNQYNNNPMMIDNNQGIFRFNYWYN